MRFNQDWIRTNYKNVVWLTSLVLTAMMIFNISLEVLTARPTQDEELRHAVMNFPLISADLTTMLRKYQASRVILFRVYGDYLDKDNGLESPGTMTKTMIYSITADNAVAADGVRIDMRSISHLPASTMSIILDQAVKNQPIHIVTDDLPDTSLKELFIRRGSVESEWMPITDAKHNFAGLLQIDWQQRLNSEKILEDESSLKIDVRILSRYF